MYIFMIFFTSLCPFKINSVYINYAFASRFLVYRSYVYSLPHTKYVVMLHSLAVLIALVVRVLAWLKKERKNKLHIWVGCCFATSVLLVGTISGFVG